MLEFVCYAIRFAGAIWFGMIPEWGRMRVWCFLADIIFMLRD